MENILTFMRHTCIPLSVATVFLLSAVRNCPKTDNTEPTPGPQPKTFLEAYSGKAQDISLGTVRLSYDLTPLAYTCIQGGGQFPASSAAQMQRSHNILYLVAGDLSFSDLLNPYNVSGIEGPRAEFRFFDPDCSGSGDYYFDPYNSWELIYQNKIPNAPKITKPTCWADFFAKTVTTTDELCIKWFCTIPLVLGASGSVSSMDVISFGQVEYPFGFTATKTKADEGEVAIRIRDGHSFLVENTITGNLQIGKYTTKAVKRRVVFSDVLSQSVCVGGQVSSSHKWLSPEIVSLVKKGNK